MSNIYFKWLCKHDGSAVQLSHIRTLFTFCVTALFLIPLSACISLDTNTNVNAPWSKTTRIGLILVSQQKDVQTTVSQTVQVLGAWVGPDGLGVGANREARIQVNQDCQIVFIIKNKAQLDHAVSLVAALPHKDGEQICINT